MEEESATQELLAAPPGYPRAHVEARTMYVCLCTRRDPRGKAMATATEKSCRVLATYLDFPVYGVHSTFRRISAFRPSSPCPRVSRGPRLFRGLRVFPRGPRAFFRGPHVSRRAHHVFRRKSPRRSTSPSPSGRTRSRSGRRSGPGSGSPRGRPKREGAAVHYGRVARESAHGCNISVVREMRRG